MDFKRRRDFGALVPLVGTGAFVDPVTGAFVDEPGALVELGALVLVPGAFVMPGALLESGALVLLPGALVLELEGDFVDFKRRVSPPCRCPFAPDISPHDNTTAVRVKRFAILWRCIVER